MNFIKISFTDNDFGHHLMIATKQVVHYYNIESFDQPSLTQTLVALTNGYASAHTAAWTGVAKSHFDYILSKIKVEFHEKKPEVTHEDVQILIDCNTNKVFQLSY